RFSIEICTSRQVQRRSEQVRRCSCCRIALRAAALFHLASPVRESRRTERDRGRQKKVSWGCVLYAIQPARFKQKSRRHGRSWPASTFPLKNGKQMANSIFVDVAERGISP